MDCNKMIEPRLLEYLRKKQYYIKNNIQPCIPLEKEYSITRNDIRLMKNYLNSDGKVNNIQYYDETTDYPIYPPHIQYKNKLHFDKIEERDKDNIRTSVYREPNFDKIVEYTDHNTKPPAFLSQIIKPRKSDRLYNNKNSNECFNHVRQQYYNNEPIEKSVLNDIILGMPSHTSKAYGYNDAFEHYFDYIDEDIQDPTHVVLPFSRGGASARLDNKKIIKH
jgi:hypothetical protein